MGSGDQMGKGGYASGRQADDLPVEVGGAGSSGLQDSNKDLGNSAPEFNGSPDKNELNPDGEQPSFSMPPFADGQDVRKTYQRPQGA
jgi:hypothetical protein